MMEWSSGSIVPPDGEIVIHIPDPGVYAAFKNGEDRGCTGQDVHASTGYQWTPRLKSTGRGSFERVSKVSEGRFWLRGIDVTPFMVIRKGLGVWVGVG